MAALDSKATVFAVAALVRLGLVVAFPGLSEFLINRVEVSTPMSSFKRLQEGLFLYSHNVSPYDGGVYHQAPLLLPLFSLLPDPVVYPLFTHLVYVALDLASAEALFRIGQSGEAAWSRLYKSARYGERWDGLSTATLFLFNPFTIATCIGHSTSALSTTTILVAIANSITGTPATAMVAIAFASYLSLFSILLVPPLLLLAYDRQSPSRRVASPTMFVARFVSIFFGTAACLLGLSYVLCGQSWQFLMSTYGIQLTLSDLAPTVGLWWYFFIEMFDSFRSFFLGVFWLHMASYVAGLSIRIRTQPLAVLTILLGLFAIFQPYPSVADTSLFLGMIPLFRHLFPLMRYSFVSAATMLYATCLGPAFYHLWIYAGSGNANFFYAVTLVWSLGQSLIVSDLAFAVLRDEWEQERPDMVGKEIRQI